MFEDGFLEILESYRIVLIPTQNNKRSFFFSSSDRTTSVVDAPSSAVGLSEIIASARSLICYFFPASAIRYINLKYLH